MKKSIYTNKLTSAIIITILLIYFMMKTPSPKIIFVPFLICSISMAGKNIALLVNKERYAAYFQKLFVTGFLLFLFGFLVVAGYICIRDKNYSLMIFSLPFWFVGIYVVKNKLLKVNSKKKAQSKFNFMMIVSVGLVVITLLAGVVVLVLGIMRRDAGLIFFGAFFTFGAFTFVLVGCLALGFFDKIKFDVVGMYIGVLFVAIGSGFIGVKYMETLSLSETIQAFGLWILVPVMMIAAGVVQIVKCVRNEKTE